MIKTARIVVVLIAVFATAGCWDETEVNGRWTGSSVPNMEVGSTREGAPVHRVHVSGGEGRFGFKVACPGHYAFVARSDPPITVFLWTERTFTGCKAVGADKLQALPGSAS